MTRTWGRIEMWPRHKQDVDYAGPMLFRKVSIYSIEKKDVINCLK